MEWINNRDTIFERGVINIFCDASMKKIYNGETIGSPGAVYIVNKIDYEHDPLVMINMDILRHSTNNHSEVYAIYMAYQLAKYVFKKVGNNPRINIFSDSQISVFGLRDWIFSWVNNSPSDILVSSTGKEVANQDIYKYMVVDMVRSNVPIYLYHNKGHVNIYNERDLENAKRIFDRSNKTNISLNVAKEISYGNNLIDNATRNNIVDFSNGNYKIGKKDLIHPYYITVDSNIMDSYKNILRGI